MTSAHEALLALGIDAAEAEQTNLGLITKGQRRGTVREICICGHPYGRHVFVAQYMKCKPTAMKCKCKSRRPVLWVTDTRFFIHKTEGSVMWHALARGIKSLKEKGGDCGYLTDKYGETPCDDCGTSTALLSPVIVSSRGYRTNGDAATGYEKLLCDTCRRGVPSWSEEA